MPKANGTTKPITPAQFIRQHILRMSVKETSAALEVAESIISRYTIFPVHHRKKLDKLARDRKTSILPAWHERVPFDKTVPVAE